MRQRRHKRPTCLGLGERRSGENRSRERLHFVGAILNQIPRKRNRLSSDVAITAAKLVWKKGQQSASSIDFQGTDYE